MRLLLRFSLICLFIYPLIIHAETYFVNSSDGSDANPGTEVAPFATIQKAADVMVAGDNCFIRKGTYRETVRVKQSGTAGAPIRFEAFQGESVYVTGTDLVPAAGWQLHNGSIYKADVSALGAVTQVFVDEQRMDIARFPNRNGEDLMSPTWGVAASVVAQQQPAPSQIIDPALAMAGADFTGGDLWLLTGLKWVSFSARVVSHTGAAISFVFPGDATDGAYRLEPSSNYFVTGLLECLDAEKEWFYDATTKTLYFYAPNGVNPAQLKVQVRTRQWGIDLTSRSNIEVANINFFAAGANMDNANNCLLEKTRIFYPVPFYAADGWATTESPQNAKYMGIKLGGHDNIVRDCEVAYSWGEGIVIFGQNNTVDNCLVHDTGWLCTDAAPIHTSGSGHIITHNTIYNAGRSGLVHRKSRALEIAYNNIYDCGLLTTDLGATYCYQTDGAGTIIHHNWVHDVKTAGHTAGIYLDNGSSNFLVHHNVVWNTDDLGIQTNLDAYNHEIYNNTIWDCSQAMGGGGGNEILENQTVYNNLSNSAAWFGTDVQQNLALSDPRFVDAGNGDFRLLADSPARDSYIIAAELLNGGFEGGTGAWTGAGGELTSVDDPVHGGSLAAFAHNRNNYWEGARQSITEVLKDHGPGRYTLEAWVKLAEGSAYGYLRFKLVDDDGDHYPGTQRKCTTDDWTKISYAGNITWKGELREAVFELMMTDADKDLVDFYIDDCALLTPAATDTTKPRGGILIPGITDDVTDGQPDAGAYEYGGADADWRAGSSLSRVEPNFPVSVGANTDQPLDFGLAQNYPNPFNSNTVFRYSLPEPANVKLVVYNSLGKQVKTLVDARQSSGHHEIAWDGTDGGGQTVASGIYFYRIQLTGGVAAFAATKKMMYLR